MGSLENPLVKCRTVQSLLKRISIIHSELIDHENSLPKCEICWENHAEFNSIKAQLFLIESSLNHENELQDNLNLEHPGTLSTIMQNDPLTMVVVKEEKKLESTENEITLYHSDVESNDNECDLQENYENSSDEELGKEKLLCSSCYKTFTTVKKLKSHIKRCQKAVSDIQNKSNVKQKLIKNNFECGLCDNKFSKKYQIISHMRLHLKPEKKKTTESTSPEEKSRISTVTFEKTEDRTCKICQKKFNTAKGLKRHVKFHENKKNSSHILKRDLQETQYTCDVCKKAFRNLSVLERHKEFRDSANLTCDICNEHFCIVKDLHNHKRFVHKINTSFKCRFCEEQFSNFRLIFRHHKMMHPLELAPESPFLCEMCGLAMMDLRDLNRHMMTLHGLNRYMCEICHKTFRQEVEFEKHNRTHIPISQLQDLYACDLCPKKFRIERSLLKHKLIHTGETVEMFCQMCRKRFTNVEKLDIHVLKHAEESSRPYKCDKCIRAFKELKLLNQHRKIVHNIFTNLMLNPKSRNNV